MGRKSSIWSSSPFEDTKQLTNKSHGSNGGERWRTSWTFYPGSAFSASLLPPGVIAPGTAPTQGQPRPCRHTPVSLPGCVTHATDGEPGVDVSSTSTYPHGNYLKLLTFACFASRGKCFQGSQAQREGAVCWQLAADPGEGSQGKCLLFNCAEHQGLHCPHCSSPSALAQQPEGHALH